MSKITKYINKIIRRINCNWLSIIYFFMILIISSVFIIAGVSKLIWLRHFEEAIMRYPVNLSGDIANLIKFCVPFVEIIAGIFLLFKKNRSICLYFLLMLLTGFTVLQIYIVMKGLDIPCGCFGPWVDEPIGKITILRNIVLIIISIFLIVIDDRKKLISPK